MFCDLWIYEWWMVTICDMIEESLSTAAGEDASAFLLVPILTGDIGSTFHMSLCFLSAAVSSRNPATSPTKIATTATLNLNLGESWNVQWFNIVMESFMSQFFWKFSAPKTDHAFMLQLPVTWFCMTPLCEEASQNVLSCCLSGVPKFF